jgi:hypothetical protein
LRTDDKQGGSDAYEEMQNEINELIDVDQVISIVVIV